MYAKIKSQKVVLTDDKYKCNDLFSRFEQQILFLEKLAETTDPTTDRHGHADRQGGLVPKHLDF